MKKIIFAFLVLAIIFVAGCTTPSPTSKRYGPFTAECKTPVVGVAGGEPCTSTSECSAGVQGTASGCDNFCWNVKGYDSAVSARGFQEGNKIMCECTCED